MKILLDYNQKELTNVFLSLGIEKYRANQLYTAMLNGKDYSNEINLPKNVIDILKQHDFVLQPIKIAKNIKSKENNIKLLYKLSDGNLVEGMLMSYKYGNTLCVSTQVGCKMNCAFCASGLGGFVRNLTAGEILGQIVAVNKLLGGSLKERKITNVVLMGSGEPLDNFENVTKFLSLLTSEHGFNMSARNISLSTCGIPQKIEELADYGIPVTLCISLHAPNDAIRTTIMPIARSYPINAVLDSAKYYHTITNRRIIIEYTLIGGVNDNMKCAKELSELLRNIPCHVNLIKLNEVKERGLKAPTQASCDTFLNNLHKFKVSATMRRTIGDDVDGACGQLRNKTIKENKEMIKQKTIIKSGGRMLNSDSKSKDNKTEKHTIKTTKDIRSKKTSSLKNK